MDYWLTTHWPQRKGQEKVAWRVWIFMADGREQAGSDIQPGDLVFVYESKRGRRLRDREYDYCDGKECIVTLARATSRLERSGSQPEQYADGTEIWWAWRAITVPVVECSIPREAVCRALGYSPNYYFRGFGDHHSGLKKLTEQQFETLRSQALQTRAI